MTGEGVGGMSLETDVNILKGNPDLVSRNPELQEAPAGAKRSKYGNVRTLYQGRQYASIKEATHARDLDLRKKAGEILAWVPQVPFLLPGGIVYVADFVVIVSDWSVRVEDAKGFRTKEYKLKRKLFKERYKRDIIEV
jgi:hypothetical protein